MSTQPGQPGEFEYIVVGSGAGGGTVAARLAEANRKVLVIEAGGDPMELQGGDPHDPGGKRLPNDYTVPCFHAFASENEAMAWDFFVRHYADDQLQQRDPNYIRGPVGAKQVDGVLYPRAGCLGGCTSHNAMITVYPHNDDWDDLARLTGDSSWSARNMRQYFERLEDCRHRPLHRWLAKLGINPSRHGWAGWLQTEKALPKSALADEDLIQTVLKSLHEAFEEIGEPIQQVRSLLQGHADPNDWSLVERDAVGVRYPPLATRNHARIGARDRLLDVARRLPDNLHIETNALATRILFDQNRRAIGVAYLKGDRLYRAHKKPSQEPGTPRQALASREVILAGGAFNTPQLLMLSGIGPGGHLKQHGIEVVGDLPGVGANLQDRYEVGVVNRMNFAAWEVLEGARFAPGDRQFTEWERGGKGVYGTNGAVLAAIKRSLPNRPLPDLFCFALLGLFRGYFPDYSKLFANNLNYLTWAILKAHTNNTAGWVRLNSADPRDTPEINFRYFDEGNDASGEDVQSVVEGIKFVRRMTAPLLRKGLIAEEELPGNHLQSDEALGDFVKYNAWGHHASCTCPIGAAGDANAVVDGKLRVRGVRNLRIVDASVFPRIPGFFIVTSVYMVGEKAADIILQDSGA
jgi:choline dehydrogenase-like flavoprotein